MARPREKTSSVDAGRIAASRRGRRDPSAERAPRSAPADRGGGKKAKAKAGGRGKKKAASSPLQKALKLVMLVLMMAALGFGTVLILDVGMTLVGGLKLGSLTFSELVDKVSDRVFDHDVPEAKKKSTTSVPKPRAAPQRSSGNAVEATPTARAPLEAPSPDAYAKDAVVRPDPEVKAARERLDQLLKGL